MRHTKESFRREYDVSRETMELLDIYANLLLKWNKSINLVAKSTEADLWNRHFADSAQILRHSPQRPQKWVDFGSGAGFPGAVIAILNAGTGHSTEYTLIESDQRKAAFLKAVARETGVHIKVEAQRIEHVPAASAGVVSARALAALSDLLGYAYRHISHHGIGLFLKGASANQEIEAALENWKFDCQKYHSQTIEGAVVLKISEIERA